MATQKFKAGDLFVVPLESDVSGFGQVISIEPEAMNSVACAFWASNPVTAVGQIWADPLAVLLATPELLKNGRWKVTGSADVQIPSSMRRYELYRAAGWVGAKVVGAGIIEKLLLAAHGKYPWNGFANPNYLTELLAPGASIPAAAFMSGGS